MILIKELALDASHFVSDMYDKEHLEEFKTLSDAGKVQWRYCYADCDAMARVLSKITGWPVIGLVSPTGGSFHRLVEAPDGRMLDANGWTKMNGLRARFKQQTFSIDREPYLKEPIVESNDEYHPILSAILQLPGAPFQDLEFRKKVLAFARTVDCGQYLDLYSHPLPLKPR